MGEDISDLKTRLDKMRAFKIKKKTPTASDYDYGVNARVNQNTSNPR